MILGILMGDWDSAPQSILVEFLNAAGSAIKISHLGTAFVSELGLDSSSVIDRPFRVAVDKKQSKAGNAYYEYWQNGLPLPDGLGTNFRVQGMPINMSTVRPSKSNGYPTREGQAKIIIDGETYEVTLYLTEGKHPYYVKVIAHKMSSVKKGEPKIKPTGGSIV